MNRTNEKVTMQPKTQNNPESVVREIKSNTRGKFNSEEKIRIIFEGLRGEASIANITNSLSGTHKQLTLLAHRQEGIKKGWSVPASAQDSMSDFFSQSNSNCNCPMCCYNSFYFCLVLCLPAPLLTENPGKFLQNLFLPLIDLVRMHDILRCLFRHAFDPLDGLQGYTSLELWAMIPPSFFHGFASRYLCFLFLQIHLQPGPVFPDHYSEGCAEAYFFGTDTGIQALAAGEIQSHGH
jgi:hypothetical protein